MNIEEVIQQNQFKSEFEKLSINLMYTLSQFTVIQQRFFRQYDLTVQQYNILRILRGQKGRPIGVNEMIDRMIDRTSNASRLVEKLRQKHLLERVACVNDRRQVEVTITKKGLSLLDELDDLVVMRSTIYSEITENEAAQFNNMLDKLRTGIAFNTTT
ncbi:MAG: DNA-binding MarR family transcriptional regulator [Flavobacteriales bacterium]|jgi:DNA-binding MarR family transcriptional regulator